MSNIYQIKGEVNIGETLVISPETFITGDDITFEIEYCYKQVDWEELSTRTLMIESKEIKFLFPHEITTSGYVIYEVTI